MKEVINFNDSWLFNKVGEEASSVNLPHTYNLEDGNKGGSFYRGLTSYKKKTILTVNDNNHVYLQVNAANSLAKIYIDGTYVTKHYGGYSRFNVDITDYVTSGKEFEVQIDVTNEHIEEVYPLMADFTFFGGLYRGVNIVVTDEYYFDLTDHGSDGVFLSQSDISKEVANFILDANVVNATDEIAPVKVQMEVKDKEGNVVLTHTKKNNIIQNNNFKFEASLENPHLWNGVKDPYLYTVVVTLSDEEGTVYDVKEIKQGFRYYNFDPQKGFYLNGEHMKLNGVSRHQCFDGVGWAQTHEQQATDISIIKEIGANSIRLAHYQQHDHFYELCDEAGFVIWAEIPFISRSSKTDKNGENALTQMRELIRQNYNHTSIMMWGVQNEITIGGKINGVEEIVEKINELAKNEDPYRVTTQAQVGHHPNEDSMHEITDILAYNKYYGWYYDEVEDFEGWLNDFNEKNPTLSLGISEYGVEGILDYQTDTPEVKDYSEQYHSLYHEKVMPIFNAHQEVWGTYVWNMFDFASAIRDEGGVQGMNNKGLVTYDRQIRKDAFYYYQALWAETPVLHLNSKRYVERVSADTYMKVYTNEDSVTLYLNGKEVETKSPENFTITFESITLVDGENTVEVKSENLSDSATFIRKDDAKTYEFEGAGEGMVDNWFSTDVTLAEEAGEIEYIDGKLSIRNSIGEILQTEEGEKVLRKYIAPLFDHAMFEMAQGFSFEAMKDFDKEVFNDVLLFTINEELKEIDAPEKE